MRLDGSLCYMCHDDEAERRWAMIFRLSGGKVHAVAELCDRCAELCEDDCEVVRLTEQKTNKDTIARGAREA